MTSRLDELRGGLPLDYQPGADLGAGDIEAGYADPESERLMERFNREAAEVRDELRRSNGVFKQLLADFTDGSASASPAALDAAGKELDALEHRHSEVRTRLRRIALENKEFQRDHGRRTAAVHIRFVQSKEMGERFIDITGDLKELRSRHRGALTRAVKEDVMRANPAVSDAQIDAALASGDRGLEVMLAETADTAELRYQALDIKARSDEIRRLTQSLVELQMMFADMSILVEDQQELINNVEHNVEDTKVATAGVGKELVKARAYQKKRNKRKAWVCIIVVAILIAIVVVIVLTVR
jgi:syntaxin 1B/2/3